MFNKTTDYIIFLLAFIALCFAAWFLRTESILATVIIAYSAIILMLMPYHHNKYIRWIVSILSLPLILLKPLTHYVKAIIITLMGIGFFYFCISKILHYCNALELVALQESLTIYLSMTISFILSTQKWAGNIIDNIVNRYHSKYEGMTYQPSLTKYIIYAIYLISLSLSYIHRFSIVNYEMGHTDIWLASFATFVAYERLISNKRLLEESKSMLRPLNK